MAVRSTRIKKNRLTVFFFFFFKSSRDVDKQLHYFRTHISIITIMYVQWAIKSVYKNQIQQRTGRVLCTYFELISRS